MPRLIGSILLFVIFFPLTPISAQSIIAKTGNLSQTIEDIAYDQGSGQVFVPDTVGNGTCMVFKLPLTELPTRTFTMPFAASDQVRGIATTPEGLLLWVVSTGFTAQFFQTDDSGSFDPPTQSLTQPLVQVTIPGFVVQGIDLDDTGALLFVQFQSHTVRIPFADLPNLSSVSICVNPQSGTGITWLGEESILQTGADNSGTTFDTLRQFDGACTNNNSLQLPDVTVGFGVDFGDAEDAGNTVFVHDRAQGALFQFRLPQTSFRRGDFDDDGALTGTDMARLQGFAMSGMPSPNCMDAADVDDNGMIDMADVASLGLILAGAATPLPPGVVCGVDPTPDALGCRISSCP